MKDIETEAEVVEEGYFEEDNNRLKRAENYP